MWSKHKNKTTVSRMWTKEKSHIRLVCVRIFPRNQIFYFMCFFFILDVVRTRTEKTVSIVDKGYQYRRIYTDQHSQTNSRRRKKQPRFSTLNVYFSAVFGSRPTIAIESELRNTAFFRSIEYDWYMRYEFNSCTSSVLLRCTNHAAFGSCF